MSELVATDAESSGVSIDRNTLKSLMRRSDRPGLVLLGQTAVPLAASGYLLHLSLGTWWVVPAMLAYGGVLATATYSLSHECAHGTAFRSRWLNEALFWLTSLVFGEEPCHRRYSHARHHTYTLRRGVDSQITFNLPLTPWGWFLEITGLGLIPYLGKPLCRNALGRFDGMVLDFTPAGELAKIKWGARGFIAIYAAIALAILAGADWLLIYLVIPRVAGGVVMQMFTIIQHAEMETDVTDLRRSTRSFRTNWLANQLYWNMSYHLEHHMFPTVPFHAMPALNAAIRDQLPAPAEGLFRANYQILAAVLRRGLGRDRALGAPAG